MNFFAELPAQAKALIAGMAFILLIAVGANFVPRPGGGGAPAAGGTAGSEQVASGMEVIYSNMEPKIAAEAAAELKDKNIPFELVRDGTAIAVPKEKADEARIKMALKGLPKEGDVGFSQLFGDKPNSFISTDFEKKVAYNRALMGELTRVVRKIDGVDGAAVIINTPEEQLFAEEKKPTTASVMVKLAPQRALTKEQVEGIQHLVASAVPGLKTNNVTVVSDSGKLLSDGMAENAGNLEDREVQHALDRQLALTREREQAVEAKVQSLLDKLYGPGKSVVRVACELDFTQKKTRRRVYAPPFDADGRTVPATRERVQERTSGASGSNGGVPGTTSNVPTYPIEVGGNGQSSSERTRERTDQGPMSLNDTLLEEQVGTIRRMSVTALIQNLPAERVPSLTEIVTAAAGADVANRGDQVVVRPAQFDNSQTDLLKQLIEQEEKAKADAALPKKKEGGIPFSWIVGTGAAFLVLLLLLAIMRLANRKEDTTDVLVNSLGDPAMPPGFAPDALAGYDPNGMSMNVPMAGGMADGPFGFLETQAPNVVADLLSRERAQSAAGILALLNTDFANEVLTYMPQEFVDEVLSYFPEDQPPPQLPAFQQNSLSTKLKRQLQLA